MSSSDSESLRRLRSLTRTAGPDDPIYRSGLKIHGMPPSAAQPRNRTEAMIQAVRTNLARPENAPGIDGQIARIEKLMRTDRAKYNADPDLQERYRELLTQRQLDNVETASKIVKNIGQSGLAPTTAPKK